MKQTRQNVFETNSSSTHSICIAKDIDVTFPESLNFEFGEFGWERSTLSSMQEKASYLYTGLIQAERQKDLDEIVKKLEKRGVMVTFAEPVKSSWGSGFETGYVDHGEELGEFLHDICTGHNKLFSFLFSDLSFIITGNDNDDYDVDINVKYPHHEYYKGN